MTARGFLRSAARRAAADDSGFSLIEVVAAMVVFSIAAASIIVLIAMTDRVTGTNRQRIQAASIAGQKINLIRDQIKNGVADTIGRTTSTQTVDATTYTTTVDTSWTSIGQTGNDCNSGNGLSGAVAYQRLAVSVDWAGRTGSGVVTNDTVVTPPANQLSADTITIPVLLETGNLVALPNMTVSVTPVGGGTTQSEVTDSNGCAVFAELTPGSYTVALNTPGYVDTKGVQAHSETDGQSSPGIVPLVTILYDTPATLTLSPACTGVAGCTFTNYPLPTGFSYTLTQTGVSGGLPALTASGSTGVSKTVFPFTSKTGSVWGDYVGATCSDGNVSSTGSTTAQPAAGGSAAITAGLDSTAVTFARANTTFSGTATITAKDAVSGCSDTYTWTVPITGAGTGSSTTGTSNISIPYGTYAAWTVKIGSTTYSGTTSKKFTPTTTTAAVTVS